MIGAVAATIATSAAAFGCECSASPPPITGAHSPELIIEGVVSGQPTVPGMPPSATMRIDHAWKGEVGTSVTLTFLDCTDGNCGSEPPIGEPIVIVGAKDASNAVHYAACSALYVDAQYRSDLETYKQQTESMVEHARAGGRTERLALAAYLRDAGESHRALELYRSLFREQPDDIALLIPIALLEGSIYDGDPKPTLQMLRQRAPDSDEWRRKVAYAAFEAACEIDVSRKDWSDVRSGERCKFENAQLEGANFDGADLSGAWFKNSDLSGASFKGANLFGVSFDESSVIGAHYDCSTKYSARYFDPKAAGMINVEGTCAKP